MALVAVLVVACDGARAPAERASGELPALWFGGDVHLGAEPRGGLEDIRALVGNAAGVVNLEGPIADGQGFARVTPSTTGRDLIELANPSGTAAFLRANGVIAANIANNHQDDNRAGSDRAPQLTTASRLESGGVRAYGAPGAPAVVEVGGVQVTLFGHDLGAEPDVAAVITRELARRPSAPAGVVVESLHVDGPPSYLPRLELSAAVDAAVAAGADIVVAHGTHVLGPVERRGSSVIAWGLGNLLFDCTCTDATEAMILRVELGPGLRAEVIPIRAGLGGAGAIPAPDAVGILDLIDALGVGRLRRAGTAGWF